jgi:hypothetical protein
MRGSGDRSSPDQKPAFSQVEALGSFPGFILVSPKLARNLIAESRLLLVTHVEPALIINVFDSRTTEGCYEAID